MSGPQVRSQCGGKSDYRVAPLWGGLASSPVATQSGTAQILGPGPETHLGVGEAGQQGPGGLSAPASVHISNERVFSLRNSRRLLRKGHHSRLVWTCFKIVSKCQTGVCGGLAVCVHSCLPRRRGRACWGVGVVAEVCVSADQRQPFPVKHSKFPEACRLLHPGFSMSPVLRCPSGGPRTLSTPTQGPRPHGDAEA